MQTGNKRKFTDLSHYSDDYSDGMQRTSMRVRLRARRHRNYIAVAKINRRMQRMLALWAQKQNEAKQQRPRNKLLECSQYIAKKLKYFFCYLITVDRSDRRIIKSVHYDGK
ncbi:hypothetical protein PAPHI01_1508 [Pancytospora philotis]|nr:hypothetical protein PAPHI01_1508 [Pancytospora philotis]